MAIDSTSFSKSQVHTELEGRFGSDGVFLSKELLAVMVSDLISSHCQHPDQINEDEMQSILQDLDSRPIGKDPHPIKAVVMGGGAFGTAMACALSRRGHQVTILMLPQESTHVDSINSAHKNTMCFPDTMLPTSIKATTDADGTFEGASLVVHAIPVQYSRKYLESIKSHLPKGCPIISVSKGISMDTLDFMDGILTQVLGDSHPLAFVAGPSFAIGIIEGEPTWCTLASSDVETANTLQKLISSSTFRTYHTTDVRGVEACSALKNVLSILCGMSIALGHSPNTTNGLLTRAWADIRSLVVGLGGKPETMSGLAGIGDLLLTCYGGLSRNSKFGALLAKNGSVEEAIKGAGGVVEGLPTSKAVHDLAEKMNIKIPVLSAISRLLEGQISPQDLVIYVMTLPLGEEFPKLQAEPAKL